MRCKRILNFVGYCHQVRNIISRMSLDSLDSTKLKNQIYSPVMNQLTPPPQGYMVMGSCKKYPGLCKSSPPL